MDELPGPSHREGTPPRRTRCRARMRDPEALQVGPGAVARLRSPILIKTPISLPFPGSGVSYLPPEGGWTSFRVRPIVRELPSPCVQERDPEALQVGPGAVARLRSPILIKTSISFPFPGSGVSYLPPEGGWTSFRVRPIVRELPGPSHRTRLREGTGKPDQWDGLRRGGRGAEPE